MNRTFTICFILFAITGYSSNNIAFANFQGGVDAFNRGDYARAYAEWLPLAEAGDPDASRNIGRLFHKGLGVQLDLTQARTWYSRSAAKCNATAQNNLGLMILNGEGGVRDPVLAFRLFERAAKQGLHADADAMGNLAGMYLSGAGTQQNVIEAYKWYHLYSQYTTDRYNREKLVAFLPRLEQEITSTQRAEALRRADAFKPTPCTPD